MLLPISKSPDHWTEEDLRKLCDDRIPENQRLDYKRELVLEPPRKRRELLKDISAFANTSGGVIIYGIEEEKHNEMGFVALRLCPLTDYSIIDKANRIIRSNISPHIEFYLYSIPSSENGFYIVAYVPQSINRPHAISWENKLDWYIRRNQDNFNMSESEIREMYFQSSSIRESIFQRYKELKLDVDLAAGWRLVCMPYIANLGILNTLKVSGQKLTTASYVNITGGSDFLQPRVDRFEEVRDGYNAALVTRLFRDGEFMIGHGYKNLQNVDYDLLSLAKYWYKGLRYFKDLYEMFEYYGPIRVWLETYNLKQAKVRITQFRSVPFTRDEFLVWIDTDVDSLNDPKILCRDLIKYFIQACEISVSENYLADLESYLSQ